MLPSTGPQGPWTDLSVSKIARPDRFALRILLFRARRMFFLSSPVAFSQASTETEDAWRFRTSIVDFRLFCATSQI